MAGAPGKFPGALVASTLLARPQREGISTMFAAGHSYFAWIASAFLVWTMTTAALATVSATKKVLSGKDHGLTLEIEVFSFNKRSPNAGR